MVGVAVEVGRVEVRLMVDLEKNLIVGLESLLLLAKHLPSVISRFITVRLHVMQRTVLLSEFCPSVCPSVYLSVCLSVRCVYCDKTKQRTANILIPHETAITLVF